MPSRPSHVSDRRDEAHSGLALHHNVIHPLRGLFLLDSTVLLEHRKLGLLGVDRRLRLGLDSLLAAALGRRRYVNLLAITASIVGWSFALARSRRSSGGALGLLGSEGDRIFAGLRGCSLDLLFDSLRYQS